MPTPFLPLPPELTIIGIQESPERLTILIESQTPTAPCPECQTPATRIHSRYIRTIADLPSGGRQVCLHWRVRTWWCEHSQCSHRIFTEQLPDFVAPTAHATQRFHALVHKLVHLCGGASTHRLGAVLGLSISASTALRSFLRCPLPAREPVRVLGVDDWGATRSCICSCKNSQKEDLTWGSALSALPG
jgi:transposase